MCAFGPPTTFHRFGPTLFAPPWSTVWHALHLLKIFSPSAGVAAASSVPRSACCCAAPLPGSAPPGLAATATVGSCSRTCTKVFPRKAAPYTSQAQSSAAAPIFSMSEKCILASFRCPASALGGTIVARRVVLQSPGAAKVACGRRCMLLPSHVLAAAQSGRSGAGADGVDPAARQTARRHPRPADDRARLAAGDAGGRRAGCRRLRRAGDRRRGDRGGRNGDADPRRSCVGIRPHLRGAVEV